MKKALKYTALIALGLCAAITITFAQSPGAGFVDFGKLQGSKEGEFVDVNIRWPIIAMASKLVQTKEPEVGKLLNGLKHIRVNVVAMAEDNRESVMKAVSTLRDSVTNGGWENIVQVKDKANDVSVSLKLSATQAIEGLIVTVLEGDRRAVLVNIVGEIRPEQIAMVGDRLNIDPLKEIGAKTKAE